MSEVFKFGLLAFTSFFTLINPLGVMPIFLSMTTELSPQERRNTARKAVIVSFFTLVAFALSGQLLFNFFGISANSFRIAGGVIFFMAGYDMLQARMSKTKVSDGEASAKYVEDISITPLAIPMMCGPGSITNGIVLMEDASTIGEKVALFGGLLVVMILTYFILWGASRISKFMGETGNKIMMRLMGLIVMVIAVEFFFSGLIPIIQSIQ